MTGFLLDTNVLSEFSRTGEPDRNVDRWLKVAEESLFASVLIFAEIRRGIELLPLGKRRYQLEQWQDDLIVSFEARFFTSPKPSPTAGPFSPRERNVIAATALEHDLTLCGAQREGFCGRGSADPEPLGAVTIPLVATDTREGP